RRTSAPGKIVIILLPVSDRLPGHEGHCELDGHDDRRIRLGHFVMRRALPNTSMRQAGQVTGVERPDVPLLNVQPDPAGAGGHLWCCTEVRGSPGGPVLAVGV